MEDYRQLYLPDGSIFRSVCPVCECEWFEERKNAPKGHSYLSYVRNYKFKCPSCETDLRIDTNWAFGYVTN